MEYTKESGTEAHSRQHKFPVWPEKEEDQTIKVKIPYPQEWQGAPREETEEWRAIERKWTNQLKPHKITMVPAQTYTEGMDGWYPKAVIPWVEWNTTRENLIQEEAYGMGQWTRLAKQCNNSTHWITTTQIVLKGRG